MNKIENKKQERKTTNPKVAYFKRWTNSTTLPLDWPRIKVRKCKILTSKMRTGFLRPGLERLKQQW